MPPNFEHLKTCCYWPHTCLLVLGAWGLGCEILDGWDGSHNSPTSSRFVLWYLHLEMYIFWKLQLSLSDCIMKVIWISLSLSLSLSRVGSLQLSPISVEITYGLERLFMLLLVNFITFFIFLLFCFIYFFNLPKFIQVWSAGCWSFEENSLCWWDYIWGAFLGKWFNFFTFFFSECVCSFSLKSCVARFTAAHWFCWET